MAKLQLDFVASVSHELLTPLAAIYCTGQNVMDGLAQTRTDSIAHGSIITSQARQLIDRGTRGGDVAHLRRTYGHPHERDATGAIETGRTGQRCRLVKPSSAADRLPLEEQ